NVFVRNELLPLQKRMQRFNCWVGKNIITFDNYIL
ncbi:capsid portal protein, partial [Salmonella enterica subsp. enterica serovar Schwarzengrund]